MGIHILPQEIASQIAAGEVVERPASVVKELIENSLDAGATSISVITEGAGQRLIEVSDNGCGIPADQLSLAVARYATSKLDTPTDLHRISTLGFRGEALASIGSISKLSLTSRTIHEEIGASVQVDGGQESKVHPIGSPGGTVVRVESLFYNVPARLKFLKHDRTERRVIDRLVTRYALAYPNIRFKLKQEGRIALQSSGNNDHREVLGMMYGTDVARQLIEVHSQEGDLDIQGFASPISLTRSNRREIIFYTNGRPIQDASLSAALLKAYHTFLMTNRYPIAVLFIHLPPEQVDVNVHPTKAEIRFLEPNLIFGGVQHAVRRALLAHSPVPGVSLQPQWFDGERQIFPSYEHHPLWGRHAIGRFDPSDQPLDIGTTVPTSEKTLPGSQADFSTKRVPLLRLVGQIASTYLVAEGPDGLYLIDQHAAHERVLFEKTMAQRDENIPSQMLIQPISVDFPPDQARTLIDQLDTVSRIGFNVELFGKNTFLLRAIPAIMDKLDPVSALHVLVEDFEEDETPLATQNEARIVARICKRAAIKAGQRLSADEQRALLMELESCKSPRTCPHGRPTMIHLSVDLLERQFGRKGAR